MGVGHPLSMKLKNVHLLHPHPNGSSSDSLLGRVLVLVLRFVAQAVGFSGASTPPVTGGRDRGKGLQNMYTYTRNNAHLALSKYMFLILY